MEHLFEKLCDYSNMDYYPFHMPGHKRNPLTEEKSYSIDITEIDGFDDLHHPEGIIKNLEEYARGIYGTRKTKILVNGSTSGLLAAISAVCPYGGKILAARNCHKAVFNAIALRGLQAEFLYPAVEPCYGLNGSIRPEDVERALRRDSGLQAVILTSPTYDGVVSDIRAISRIVHAYGLPLLVDEAHGAHLPFSAGLFPESALKGGADIVIHSLHKTLPSLTQTALLHVNSSRVDLRKVCHYLSVYQSSSPSYILMASVGSCLKWLEEESEKAFAEYEKQLIFWRRKYAAILEKSCAVQLVFDDYGIGAMDNGKAIGKKESVYDFDVSKFIFSVKGRDCSGEALYRIFLQKYHLQMEMAAPSYVLALSSVFDREEGFKRLEKALEGIEKDVYKRTEREEPIIEINDRDKLEEKVKLASKQVMTLGEAADCAGEIIPLTESLGRISGSSLYLYPPGIPFLLPGEEITQEVLAYMECMKKEGAKIHGLEEMETIFVLKNKLW